jgi:hypothetical protein
MLRLMQDMPVGTIGFEAIDEVGDEDWMRPAVRALSALLPGKAKAFRVHDLAAAKAWLAEGLGP